MKKIIFLFAFALFLAVNTQAQEPKTFFTVHGNSAVQDFAVSDQQTFNENMGFDELYGYSGFGIGIGIKHMTPLWEGGLYMPFQLDIFANTTNKDMRSNFTYATGASYANFVNIPLATGFGFQAQFTKKFSAFVQVNGLFNSVKMTKTGYSDGANIVAYQYKTGHSLGWGSEIGFVFDKYSLSVAYKNMGTHVIVARDPVGDRYEIEKNIAMVHVSFGVQLGGRD